VLAWEPDSKDVSLLWFPQGAITPLLSILTFGILGEASRETEARNRAVDRASGTILKALEPENSDRGVDTHGVWKSAYRQWPDD
tara:strand:- start:25 stop:276 length:252 start_codon:yes stop_codon:yes gene_type:complete